MLNKSEFRSHNYTLLDSFEELTYKRIKAVFNISGQKKVFVTDSCVLVTLNGLPLNGNSMATTTGILEEIERETGISPKQYINS